MNKEELELNKDGSSAQNTDTEQKDRNASDAWPAVPKLAVCSHSGVFWTSVFEVRSTYI